MVKRTSFEHDGCPVARALDVIGDWWSILIIRDAFFGVSRFSEFQKNLGLARNILTVRLRTLVDQGIMKNAPHPVNATKFMEYLASDDAQRYFANGNNEWPTVASVSVTGHALESLGSFKIDPLPIATLGKNTVEAQKMVDRAGWK